MNRVEALKILGLDPSASDDDAKKKFRELSKKFHPDVNKEPDAESKFKEINAAYSAVQNPEPEVPFGFGGAQSGQPGGMNDFLRDFIQSQFNINIPNNFVNFNHQSTRNIKSIEIGTNISFEESVTGCERDLNFDRDDPCSVCNGFGFQTVPRSTPCVVCKGKGKQTVQRGGMTFIQTCGSCLGQDKVKVNCKSCNGSSVKSVNKSCRVTIPPGVVDGNVLRLSQMGHFTRPNVMPNRFDVFVKISVKQHPEMKMVDGDVVSNVNISLLDCLQGTTVKVSTVYDTVDVTIPPETKNKDEILIPNHGVGKSGNHRVVVNAKYPEVSSLIEFLKNKEITN